ncbi:MAG: hypothetical protein HXK88_05170 [Lachnospiraceae bacterium]|nr:hypothetical protein [Lachnospiraceae bacterium]
MNRYLIGIDIGTTGTKTILFSASGKRVGHAYCGYRLMTPGIGRSEQEAEDWWNAVKKTVREVTEKVPDPQNVVAISLSLQGGTFVPVDRQGTPLRSAIVWNDKRCIKEMKQWKEQIGDKKDLYRTTGWPLGPSLPLMQIRNFRMYEKECFDLTEQFLTVPDFISRKMTGCAVTDISDAGINQLYDIRKERYDETLLHFAGVREDQLPKVVPSGEVIGNIAEEAAKEFGLSTKTVLIAGAHDQYAVAVGGGALEAGDFCIGSGTAWVVTGMADQPDFSHGLSQSRTAIPNLWGSIASLSTGGLCLEWLRDKILSLNGKDPLSYEQLNREIDKKQSAFDHLFFYPFSGKYGKARDVGKGAFIGLDLSHGPFDLAAAVMESIVFQTKWMLGDFKGDRVHDSVCLSGGASKSAVWSQMVADILGVPVRIPEIADLACVGAAVIAGVGAGVYDNIREGYEQLKVPFRILTPDKERKGRYEEAGLEYRRLAEKLGEAFVHEEDY